jgi:hypothetical protein
MPNNLLTVDVIAGEAIATLYESTVMAGLVHRDYEGDFTGNSGDVITIRKPTVFTVNEFDRDRNRLAGRQRRVDGAHPELVS